MTAKPTLIYVGDPMCSWCWGLAPTIERIAAREDVATRVVVGGLRPGENAAPLDDGLRQYLLHHWEKISELSGQPFSKSALQRENWVYDTEVPAIAVTTMRHLAEPETIRFLTHVQRAFYAGGVDITDPGVYPALLSGFDLDAADFMTEMASAEAKTRAWKDFAEARELGVLGFPTVLLEVDGSIQVLSRGYASSEHFDNQLAYWVELRQPNSADVGTCSIDRVC